MLFVVIHIAVVTGPNKGGLRVRSACQATLSSSLLIFFLVLGVGEQRHTEDMVAHLELWISNGKAKMYFQRFLVKVRFS